MFFAHRFKAPPRFARIPLGTVPQARVSKNWKKYRIIFQGLETYTPTSCVAAPVMDKAAATLHNKTMTTPSNTKSAARVPELMAPAGNLEAGYAALHFGADAVYLGLQKFSARADADNFSLDDLDRLTAYAHALEPRRKVFVALNTLILQKELREVIAAIAEVADLGVDALIVQDLGVLRIARRHFPELRLHASTQMAIHNLEGARTLQDMGFHRITLARELTLDEIREISRGLRAETEFFAHGALCYSYSGLCLISSMLMGRSGNRGRCAYLCRDRFGGPDEKGGRFLFSMKDLAVADQIQQLREAGVASLKIEGRKKSPLYVAATVHFYRQLLDGKLDAAQRRQLEADIQSIFSRPWTALHLDNKHYAEVTDPSFVGHRGTPVGTVEDVVTREGGHWLRFTAQRDIERFDGLQLELEGLDKPYGFSAEQIAVRRGRGQPKSVFAAKAGSCVEVLLPAHHPLIPCGIPIYCSSSQAVKRRYRYDRPKPDAYRVRFDADVVLTLTENGAQATARSGSVAAEHEMRLSLKPARDKAQLQNAIQSAFEKTGGTRFRLRSLRVENPGAFFVPISALNELRRVVLERLEQARQEQQRQHIEALAAAEAEPSAPSPRATGSLKWSIKVAAPDNLSLFGSEDRAGVEEVVLDIGRIETDRLLPSLTQLAHMWGEQRVRVALPLITRAWERKELVQKIALLRSAGCSRWEVSGMAAWSFLGLDTPARPAQANDDITCDWPVYVLNRAAAKQLLAMGATRFVFSPEDTFENLRALLAEFADRGIILLYQDTPLFISENCVRPTAQGWSRCPGPGSCPPEPVPLRSSHGDRLLLQTRSCRTVVISEAPLCWSALLDKLRAAGAQWVRGDFSWRTYSAEQTLRIWRALRSGRAVPGSQIGNFERGLL